jgi:hypothetical protein
VLFACRGTRSETDSPGLVRTQWQPRPARALVAGPARALAAGPARALVAGPARALVPRRKSGGPKTGKGAPGALDGKRNGRYLSGGIGIMPGNTYACSMAITPITAAPAMECQNTVRKIGPSAKLRSFGSS